METLLDSHSSFPRNVERWKRSEQHLMPQTLVRGGDDNHRPKSFIAQPPGLALRLPDLGAAQVAADFLLSPEAQAKKADLKVWGDPTVLDLDRLPPDKAALFAGSGDVPGTVETPAPALPEPHASWVPLIEAAWLERYGA